MVNISSVQSHRAQAVDMGWTYATSKGAVTAMSRRMALDLSPHGIRVNSIPPGYTWTAMVTLHVLLVFMLNCGSLPTLCILLLSLLVTQSPNHSITHSFAHSRSFVHSFLPFSFVYSFFRPSFPPVSQRKQWDNSFLCSKRRRWVRTAL